MGKFEFKSAICTSVEQSKRLLELGLKKETADMCYKVLTHNWTGKEIPEKNRHYVKCTWYDENDQVCGMERYKTIPAWSLSRLIELCEPIPISSDWLYKTDAYYENIIACIAWRISKESFNPQFLEERK